MDNKKGGGKNDRMIVERRFTKVGSKCITPPCQLLRGDTCVIIVKLERKGSIILGVFCVFGDGTDFSCTTKNEGERGTPERII